MQNRRVSCIRKRGCGSETFIARDWRRRFLSLTPHFSALGGKGMQEISRVTWNKLLRPGETAREGRAGGGKEGQRLLRATNRTAAALCKGTDLKGLLHSGLARGMEEDRRAKIAQYNPTPRGAPLTNSAETYLFFPTYEYMSKLREDQEQRIELLIYLRYPVSL